LVVGSNTSGRTREAPLLSVVIPAYNEEANIRGGVLRDVVDYLSGREYASEVIVVDDGSEDSTVALVEEAARAWPIVTLKRSGHGGKARAVTAGVLAARGDLIVFTDMDQSTPIRYVDEVVSELQAGNDVVIGSRWMRGSARLREPPVRNVLGRGFALLVRTLLLPGISDSQCGFKGFRREAARELFGGMRVFGQGGGPRKGPMVTAFDVELLVLATKRRYRVKEIPVTWHHVATARVNPIPDACRMFKQVAQVWFNRLRGQYNAPDG